MFLPGCEAIIIGKLRPDHIDDSPMEQNGNDGGGVGAAHRGRLSGLLEALIITGCHPYLLFRKNEKIEGILNGPDETLV